MLPGQPDSTKELLASQQIFRIRQQITSPGDIIEIDSSALACWIGPSSDIAEVTLLYPNDQAPSEVLETVIAPNGPWVGRMDARLDKLYQSTGEKKRLLAFPTDVVDPNYQRPMTAGATNPFRRFNLPVELDLIFAYKASQLPTVPAVRADKTIRLPQVPFEDGSQGATDDGSTDIVVPIYGRKLISVQVVLGASSGMIFTPQLATVISGNQQTPASLFLDTVGAGTNPQTRNYVIRANQERRTDDTSLAGPEPLRGPMGQADLLVINIADNGGTGTQFADVFIRLSDRD